MRQVNERTRNVSPAGKEYLAGPNNNFFFPTKKRAKEFDQDNKKKRQKKLK
jgi:hypothetical protein